VPRVSWSRVVGFLGHCRWLVSDFELDWCEHAKRGMSALAVVEAFEVFEDWSRHDLVDTVLQRTVRSTCDAGASSTRVTSTLEMPLRTPPHPASIPRPPPSARVRRRSNTARDRHMLFADVRRQQLASRRLPNAIIHEPRFGACIPLRSSGRATVLDPTGRGEAVQTVGVAARSRPGVFRVAI
jgi:hypothetical protein